jgi:hypothetical protein
MRWTSIERAGNGATPSLFVRQRDGEWGHTFALRAMGNGATPSLLETHGIVRHKSFLLRGFGSASACGGLRSESGMGSHLRSLRLTALCVISLSCYEICARKTYKPGFDEKPTRNSCLFSVYRPATWKRTTCASLSTGGRNPMARETYEQ